MSSDFGVRMIWLPEISALLPAPVTRIPATALPAMMELNTRAAPVPLLELTTIPIVLLNNVQFSTVRLICVEPLTRMPAELTESNPRMFELRTSTSRAERMLIPLIDDPVDVPSKSSPSITTLAVAGALMTIPLVPLTRTPASMLSERSVMVLVIVTPPNPPGSSTLISPPVAVLEMAPANVLHGAVREQGLASSPTPETQVRVACAMAGAAETTDRTAAAASNFHVFCTLDSIVPGRRTLAGWQAPSTSYRPTLTDSGTYGESESFVGA